MRLVKFLAFGAAESALAFFRARIESAIFLALSVDTVITSLVWLTGIHCI
jgi:hypothetical protein